MKKNNYGYKVSRNSTLTVIISVLILISSFFTACSNEKAIESKDIIVDFKYDKIVSLANGLFLTEINKGNDLKESGIIDSSGKYIYGPKICNIVSKPIFWDGKYYYEVQEKDYKGLIDEKGAEIFPIVFKNQFLYKVNFYDFLRYDDELVPFAVGEDINGNVVEKWGYISKKTGKEVIQPKYSHAYPFHNGVAKVQTTVEEIKNTDWGANNVDISSTKDIYAFIDKDGNIVGNPSTELNINYDNGFFPQVVKTETRKVYQPLLGEDSTYTVNTYVFVDKNKNKLNNTEFIKTTGFYKGYAYVAFDQAKYWSIMDDKGNITNTNIPYNSFNQSFFLNEYNCFTLMENNNISGYYNEIGEKINISDNFIKNIKTLDTNGINANIDDIDKYSDLQMIINDKYIEGIISGSKKRDFIDPLNKRVISPELNLDSYDFYNYDNQYIYIKNNDHYYVVDLTGKVIFDQEEKDGQLCMLINKIPLFQNSKELYYTDSKGKKNSIKLTSAVSIGDGRLIANKEGKYGIIKINIE